MSSSVNLLSLLATITVLSAFIIQGSNATSACSIPACATCTSTSVCTACDPLYGLTSTNQCLACNTMSGCYNCTVLTQCTQCSLTTSAPNNDGSGTCSPCAPNCGSCMTNGPGTCDSGTCTVVTVGSGYRYNNVTMTCDQCKVTNCSVCSTDINQCNTCNSGSGVVIGTNKTVCNLCSAHCGPICPTNGGGFCDYGKCKAPYGLNNATKLCELCGPNCTKCTVNGAGLCDGQAFCNNTSIFQNSTLTCGTLQTTTAMTTTTTVPTTTTSTTTMSSTTTVPTTTISTTTMSTTTTVPTTTTSTTTMSPSTTVPTTTTSTMLNTSSPCPTTSDPIVTRCMWGAVAPSSTPPTLATPCPIMMVHHTMTAECFTSTDCINVVRGIQKAQMADTTYSARDVCCNVFIGGDGKLYEGVGFTYQGQAMQTAAWNAQVISVCFIGTFTSTPPKTSQFSAFDTLITLAQSKGVITSSYKLKYHKQVDCTKCAGGALNNRIMSMPNYDSVATSCQSYGWLHPMR